MFAHVSWLSVGFECVTEVNRVVELSLSELKGAEKADPLVQAVVVHFMPVGVLHDVGCLVVLNSQQTVPEGWNVIKLLDYCVHVANASQVPDASKPKFRPVSGILRPALLCFYL